MEADRFENLKYPLEAFKTETGAVLGEYNKNSANPGSKLEEVLTDTAFDRHTYKHTTMGFLKDVQDMPNQYDYSIKFFDRYYRPEYTTIIVAGDVDAKQARALVDKSFGDWKRGSYHADIPVEPKQDRARARPTSIGRRPRCLCSLSPTKAPHTPTRQRTPRRWTHSRLWSSGRIRSCIRNWWSANRSWTASAPMHLRASTRIYSPSARD